MSKIIKFDHTKDELPDILGLPSYDNLKEIVEADKDKEMIFVLSLSTVFFNKEADDMIGMFGALLSVMFNVHLNRPSKLLEYIYLQCDTDRKKTFMEKLVITYHEVILNVDVDALNDEITKHESPSQKTSIRDLQTKFDKAKGK